MIVKSQCCSPDVPMREFPENLNQRKTYSECDTTYKAGSLVGGRQKKLKGK